MSILMLMNATPEVLLKTQECYFLNFQLKDESESIENLILKIKKKTDNFIFSIWINSLK